MSVLNSLCQTSKSCQIFNMILFNALMQVLIQGLQSRKLWLVCCKECAMIICSLFSLFRKYFVSVECWLSVKHDSKVVPSWSKFWIHTRWSRYTWYTCMGIKQWYHIRYGPILLLFIQSTWSMVESIGKMLIWLIYNWHCVIQYCALYYTLAMHVLNVEWKHVSSYQ